MTKAKGSAPGAQCVQASLNWSELESRRLDREGERIESLKPHCSALTGDF